MYKRLILFPVLVLALGGCVTFRAGAPPDVIDVIAHRGASHIAPENTMAAFRRAHEMGAHWFELDCYLSRDNEVVVFHDATLERTAGVQGRVADNDLAYLRTLDVGSWKAPHFAGEPLPTLGEALDFAKHKIGVYVEIKNMNDDSALMAQLLDLASSTPIMTPELAHTIATAVEASGTRNLELTRKCIALIRERNMQRSIVIQSFSPIICAVARIEAPEMRVELLSGVEADEHADWEATLRWAYLLNVDGLNLSGKGLTPGRLAVVQASGKRVAVWTINHPAEMRQFAAWGVNAIITDRPDLCLRTLGQQDRNLRVR